MRFLTALLPLTVLLLVSIPEAVAWGQLGHRTVALLSTRFLLPTTSRAIRRILGKQSIISASTWPDYYAHTRAGRYSASWHWIDAKDSPPSQCGISFSRDCPKDQGCIVSALTNMTDRVVDLTLPDWERMLAMRFIIHFMGDIGQPLHTEDMERGGNGIHVLWKGNPTNLHHVWDSSIPETHRRGKSITTAVKWADELYETVIAGDRWDVNTEGWGTCMDPQTAQECVLSWADETNTWMCKYVLPETGIIGEELGEEYYEGARPIVDMLVAKAGWRLAAWLNMIFTGRTGMENMEEMEWERESLWSWVEEEDLLWSGAGEL